MRDPEYAERALLVVLLAGRRIDAGLAACRGSDLHKPAKPGKSGTGDDGRMQAKQGIKCLFEREGPPLCGPLFDLPQMKGRAAVLVWLELSGAHRVSNTPLCIFFHALFI